MNPIRKTLSLPKRIVRKFISFVSPPKPQELSVLDLNGRYDLETIEVMKRLGVSANCIDIGAHKGDILRDILKYAPQGRHFAFEPIPDLAENLQKEFGRRCTVYPYALSEENGQTEFNYVISNPAYSGIKKRQYDRPHENDTLITVQKRRLDELIPAELPIHFMKIDVEGGEFQVLRGAKKILQEWKPVIVYEQGLGGSNIYGTTPGEFYDFMNAMGYSISLMEYYLMNKKPLSREDYCTHFNNGYNFYFIAYHI